MICIYNQCKDFLFIIRNFRIFVLVMKLYFYQIFLIIIFMEAFKILKESKQIQYHKDISSKGMI